jgi:hypothetical protein
MKSCTQNGMCPVSICMFTCMHYIHNKTSKLRQITYFRYVHNLPYSNFSNLCKTREIIFNEKDNINLKFLFLTVVDGNRGNNK